MTGYSLFVDGSDKIVIKDSGERMEFESGMVRQPDDDKIDYTLLFPKNGVSMLIRWAKHLTNGAKKYAARNWEKANTEEELERFRQSAFRHFVSWLNGEEDEDHAAAIYFNIQGAELVGDRLKKQMAEQVDCPNAVVGPVTNPFYTRKFDR